MQKDRQLLACWLADNYDHKLKTASDLLLSSLEDAHLQTKFAGHMNTGQ